MAQIRQPKIEIEDLQPKKTRAGYHASWQEGTLIAHAWLDPIGDQPANGFTIEYTYNHVQLNRRLSEKQIDLCTTLVSKLRNVLEERLQRAGWREIARLRPGRSIWQHASRIALESSPADHTVQEDRQTKARRLAEPRAGEIQTRSEQESVTQQPTVEIDDFTVPPMTPAMKARHERPLSYNAQAVQGDVKASITVRHYGDYRYPGGYILDKRTSRVNEYAGKMGKKQEARARALLVLLEERVYAALLAAGWVQRWKTPLGADLWLFTRELQEQTQAPPQSDQAMPVDGQTRVLTIKALAGRRQSKGYTRTITARPVTYTCLRCGQEATTIQFPGRTPRYCKTCAPIVTREQTRARVLRLRTTRRGSQPPTS